AELNFFSSLGGFISSLIGGYLINTFGFNPVFFYITAFLGFISIIPLLKLKQGKIGSSKKIRTKVGDREKLISIIVTVAFLNFSVTIAGPMMPIFLVKRLNASKFDIAILNAVAFIGSLLFLRPMGMLTDIVGRKKVMLASLLLISLFPLPYFLASKHSDINYIILYSFLGNIAWASFNIASFSYLSDVATQPFERSTTLYSFFTTLASFFGSLVSGVLAESLGYKNLFLLSLILRVSSIFLFVKLKEAEEEKLDVFILPFGYPLFENFVYVYSIAFRRVGEDISKQISEFLKVLRRIR
ncbi:MAG: MFS transporter, partial [Candidatus Micrarchaeia archaeon]